MNLSCILVARHNIILTNYFFFKIITYVYICVCVCFFISACELMNKKWLQGLKTFFISTIEALTHRLS